ncbi:SLAM family member 6-like [Lithobates pipiens]
MSHFYFWIVVLLNLKNYAASERSCGEGTIAGAVGGNVTLQVGHAGVTPIRRVGSPPMTLIFWKFGKDHLITTMQGLPNAMHPIVTKEFSGRLNSTSDGSLTISELKREDQGTYNATIFTTRFNSSLETCIYHLTVFGNLTAENVTINPDVTDNKTCEVSLTCLVDSVDGSKVTINWRSLNISNVNQTENVVFVPPSNVNFTYICTAKNPVSNVSKSVVPWLYCNNGTDRENTPKEDYTMVNLIRLVISGCVLLITCCIFIHHMKTEVISQPPETGAI